MEPGQLIIQISMPWCMRHYLLTFVDDGAPLPQSWNGSPAVK